MRLSIIGELRNGSWQPDLADRQTLWSRLVSQVFQCQQTSGARHVFNDDGWMARDVSPEILRDRAAIQIVSAAGRPADDDPQDLTFETGFGARRRRLFRATGQKTERRRQHHHASFPQTVKAHVECQSTAAECLLLL